MKSLLLAATQYRAAKTPANAALLQRSLEVRAASGRGGRGAAGNVGVAVVFLWALGTWAALLRAQPRLSPFGWHCPRRPQRGLWSPCVSSGPYRPRRCLQVLVWPAPRLSGRRHENLAGDRLLGWLVAEGGRRTEETFQFFAASPDFYCVLHYNVLWCLCVFRDVYMHID